MIKLTLNDLQSAIARTTDDLIYEFEAGGIFAEGFASLSDWENVIELPIKSENYTYYLLFDVDDKEGVLGRIKK